MSFRDLFLKLSNRDKKRKYNKSFIYDNLSFIEHVLVNLKIARIYFIGNDYYFHTNLLNPLSYIFIFCVYCKFFYVTIKNAMLSTENPVHILFVNGYRKHYGEPVWLEDIE